MGQRGHRALWICLVVAGVAALVAVVVVGNRPVGDQRLGVTFSTRYARNLGLDPREAFVALLDDVGVRRFRIPVYWTDVQPAEDAWQWEETDWMMREAATRGAEVTLAIGYRVPRWPECYAPDWALGDDRSPDRVALTRYLRAAVERYRGAPALANWQVENEPFLAYGECEIASIENVDEEIALVRALDPSHPVVQTVSGELQRWGPSAQNADVLGISIYRVTWNKYLGFLRYPLPPAFYRLRAWLASRSVDQVIISELQAEPWFPEGTGVPDAATWATAFSAEDLRENVGFAARTGITDADLWGAEWWYYLSVHGEPSLWEEARELFAELEM